MVLIFECHEPPFIIRKSNHRTSGKRAGQRGVVFGLSGAMHGDSGRVWQWKDTVLPHFIAIESANLSLPFRPIGFS